MRPLIDPATARRRVVDADRRIGRQQILILELLFEGRDTRQAERLLRQMEKSRAALTHVLRDALVRSGRPSASHARDGA